MSSLIAPTERDHLGTAAWSVWWSEAPHPGVLTEPNVFIAPNPDECVGDSMSQRERWGRTQMLALS